METRTYDFSDTVSPLEAAYKGTLGGMKFWQDFLAKQQAMANASDANARENDAAGMSHGPPDTENKNDANARANEDAGMEHAHAVGHALDQSRMPVDPGMSAGPQRGDQVAVMQPPSAPVSMPAQTPNDSMVPQVGPHGIPMASAPKPIPPAMVGAALQQGAAQPAASGAPVSAAADTGIHKSFGQTLAEGWKAGVERINQGYTPNSPLVKTHQSKAEIAEAARSQDEDAKAKARSADVAAQNETRIRVAEINANARIRTAHIYMQQSGLNSDPVGKQLSDVVKSAEARMKSASDQKIALEKNVLAKPADVARAQADYESAVNEARQAADELNGYAQTHTFNTAPASGGPPGRRVPAPSGNAPPPPNAPKKTTYTKPPSMSQADWQKYLKDTNQVE